eukprot:6213742-Pleurochrysis_carterae.AAC.1
MHPTNHTLDDHVWVATLEEKWGVDPWPALFTQADTEAVYTDASAAVEILVVIRKTPIVLAFRAQLHRLANSHREARTHTVLIADTGPRSQPDHTNPAQLTWLDMRAVRVDRVLSWIPRYAWSR